ncbi:MAG: SPOR domain-containing protein [Steroidobacteraceae bacterium]
MRFTYRAAGPITAAVVLTLLAGCSRTQEDWRTAQQAGTPQAYAVFVKRHPDSELAGVARQRIAHLTEAAAWQQATRANTAAAYQSYLAKYPNGSWSQDARIRMESKSLAAAPQGAAAITPGAGGPVTAPDGSASAPSSPPAQATAIPPNSAVQLGAFSSGANAREAWRQLSFRFRAQLAGLTSTIIPVTVSGRRFYRLEARVATQSAARRLCRQLQQDSQGCLPLP